MGSLNYLFCSKVEMVSGQKILTWVRLGQTSLGQENFPQKANFYPAGPIKSLKVRAGSAPYLLQVIYMLGSGQGPSLLQRDHPQSKTVQYWFFSWMWRAITNSIDSTNELLKAIIFGRVTADSYYPAWECLVDLFAIRGWKIAWGLGIKPITLNFDSQSAAYDRLVSMTPMMPQLIIDFPLLRAPH